MEVRDHLPLAELERLEREERDARRSKRLRIIILAIKGYTAPAIAMSLGLSRRVCQDWVYRFNEQGLQGLEDQWGGHRQGPLTPEEEQQMRQRLDGGPTPEDDVCSLRGVDVQRILAQEFGVLRSLPAVYYLLHQLGYSYLRPRPRHRKFDAEVQADFQRRLPEQIMTIAAEHPGKQVHVFFQDEAQSGSREP